MKRERAIPVKVTLDTRPAPTSLPPQTAPLAPLEPKKAKPKPSITAPIAKPVQALRQPVHNWSVERRRRLMWWLVGGGTAVIVIGWLAVVRYEFNGNGNQPNLFSDLGRLLKTVRWPGSPEPTPAEKEIQRLDQQVFPQFQ